MINWHLCESKGDTTALIPTWAEWWRVHAARDYDGAYLIATLGDSERKECARVIIILKHFHLPKAEVCPAWHT